MGRIIAGLCRGGMRWFRAKIETPAIWVVSPDWCSTVSMKFIMSIPSVAKDGLVSKNAVLRLIKKFLPGAHNTIPIPLELVRLLGNYEEAAIFSQCMYWSERTDNPDGWFWKRYDEWEEELAINERTCRRKLNALESRGWVETMVKKVRGVRALHVRVLEDNFIDSLTEAFLKPENPDSIGNGQNGRLAKQSICPVGETDKMAVSSITETTGRNYDQETTQENMEEATGEPDRSPRPFGRSDQGSQGGETEQHSPPGKQKDQKQHTPAQGSEPKSSAAAPRKAWKLGQPLPTDSHGYAVLPRKKRDVVHDWGCVATAKYKAVLWTQRDIAGMCDNEGMSLNQDDDGEFWVETIDGENHESEAFAPDGDLPLRKLRDIAIHGIRGSFLSQDGFNEILQENFEMALRQELAQYGVAA